MPGADRLRHLNCKHCRRDQNNTEFMWFRQALEVSRPDKSKPLDNLELPEICFNSVDSLVPCGKINIK